MQTKILFILHLPPPVHGAAMMGKYIRESRLINDSFDCRYINLTTATSLEDIGKGGIRKLWRFVGLLKRIRREVKSFRPDLVYVTPNACGKAFYKDYVIVQMLNRMGCHVVAHYHNKGVATCQHRWFQDKLYRRFFKKLQVILLADALYDDVKKYVRQDDVHVCGNGIPLTVLDTEPLALRHNETTRLLFLSNLLIEKGVLVLLDALNLLKERGCVFTCDFVGGETADMDAERFKHELKIRGLEDVAAYRGKRYGDEKCECFRQADIFVFPTLNETFGLVSLEAMEYKLPVVATNEGGIPDVVQDNVTGFLCRKKDAHDLADKIGILLSDEKLRLQMGENGYRRFRLNFTVSAFEHRMCRTLQDVLSKDI